jgi:hypothetical protein
MLLRDELKDEPCASEHSEKIGVANIAICVERPFVPNHSQSVIITGLLIGRIGLGLFSLTGFPATRDGPYDP